MIPFLYLITNLLWAVYTGHIFLLLVLWRKEQSATQSGDSAHPLPDASVYPLVTVQLPFYNEAVVASRLLEAVARLLDYPRDRLQIQVLDDSTDETTAILTRLAAGYQQKGWPLT